MKSSEQSDKASQPTFMQRERGFIALIGFFLIVAGSTYQLPDIARWVGFLLAGYAAIANDSIQTIGTFIASNKSKPWWLLWIFIGGIFLVTMYMSFVSFGGPIDIEMKKVVDEKGAVLKESKDTVLRISLQDSEEKISFREITLDITEGEFAGRESLGFDISKGWSVKTVEIGQSSKNKCFLALKFILVPQESFLWRKKHSCATGINRVLPESILCHKNHACATRMLVKQECLLNKNACNKNAC